MSTSPAAADLIARSNRLGADPRNTNYAGGNTSAKGTVNDPVTGQPVELMWVKGSGGDLGTLQESGLAVLRMDRMRALVGVYPGIDREDEMVAAFDYCLHGKGGAAPSIDTAMHGLVDAAHVDHLHPDSGIAIATAIDGEALTTKIFGDKVVWVPWRRPGFQLGLDIAAIKKQLADYATSAEMRRVEDVGLTRSGLDEVGIQTMRSAWEREPKATRGESPVKWWEGQVAIAKEHAADPKKPAPALHPTVAVLLPKFEPSKDAGKGNGRDPLPRTPERRQGGGELVRGQGRAALEKSIRQG